jgi:glycosyltransferase involved in cell wall biosynthesis
LDPLPTMPLVTAIIPTYRRAGMLHRAVRTVLAQDYPTIEVIVVDDNTDPDEQRAVREALSDLDGDIVIIPNSRTKGGCGARNTGIAAARGEFVAFLDDDDEWAPAKLRQQVVAMQRSGLVGSFCGYTDIDLAFDHARQCRASKPLLTRDDALRGECPTSTSLVMVRTETLRRAGLFDESLPSFQDFDMWLRCLAFGDFGYLDQPLARFIQHAGERTSVNLKRRLNGLAAIELKWGAEMKLHQDLSAFRRRVLVDALLANGRAGLEADYWRALRFFLRAFYADRGSKRAGFWLLIGALGFKRGRALYTRLLGFRKIETVAVNA